MITEPATVLLTLGGVFLLGMVADLIGRRTPVPRVALLILSGIVIGPEGLALLPAAAEQWFPVVSDLALVIVGFLVGGYLSRANLAGHGRAILTASALVTLTTAVTVFAGSLLLGLPFAVAAVLAAVACATDPAATLDSIKECGARGPFSRVLGGIVALDDAWGLIVFTLAIAAARLATEPGSVGETLGHGAFELLGAVAIGIALGLPMAMLTGRLRPGEPTQAEAMGMVLICGGLALVAEVSFLLAAMTMGAVVSNVAKHHRRPFHAIEGIEWPFLMVFFVLAGASLRLDSVLGAFGLLAGYVVLRILGRVLGGLLSAGPAELQKGHAHWLGAALLPQAGVAIGMTLVASQTIPEIGEVLLPVVLAGTVLFELAGPVATRFSLVKVGEAAQSRDVSGTAES